MQRTVSATAHMWDSTGMGQGAGRPFQVRWAFPLTSTCERIEVNEKESYEECMASTAQKKSKVFGEHLLCSGTSQMLSVRKPKVESTDSNLYMAQKRCVAFALSVSLLILIYYDTI